MAARLVANLRVFPDRMRAAVDHTRGLVFSSVALADMLADGVEREKAYRLVQDAANQTATSGEDFRDLLAGQAVELGQLVPERFLTNHHVIRERLESLRELED
jgi:adenylosuccinate lyase